MVTAEVSLHFLPESQYPGGTGKFIYQPLILDEKHLHLKQDQLRSHKVPSSLGL